MFKSLRKKNTSWLGVDINVNAIRLLQLNYKKARYTIACCQTIPLQDNRVSSADITDYEQVSSAIKTSLAKIACKTKVAAISIPDTLALTKIVQVAKNLSKKELESYIALQATQIIPHPVSEINLDFCPLGLSKDRTDTRDVLVVATRKEEVNRRLTMLNAAGLTVQVVELRSHAFARACKFISNCKSSLDAGKTLLIIDIAGNRVRFIVLRYFIVLYTHEEIITPSTQNNQTITSKDLAPPWRSDDNQLASDYTQYTCHLDYQALLRQLRRSIDLLHSSQAAIQVDSIVLTGDCDYSRDFIQLLQNNLRLPIQFANPFQDMDLASEINLGFLYQQAPAYLACCGLAARYFIR